jgi:hypothetical protein
VKDTIPLVAAACFIIVVAGLRAAAPIVSLLLLAVLLTTSVAPVVLWQLRRGWSKERAILLTVLGVAAASVLAGSLVALSVAGLARNLPGYETRLAAVLHSLAESLAARGIDLPDWKTIEALSPSRLVGYASSFLGTVISAFSDGFLVLLLVLFIIVDGADRRFKYDQGLLPPDSWWGCSTGAAPTCAGMCPSPPSRASWGPSPTSSCCSSSAWTAPCSGHSCPSGSTSSPTSGSSSR